MENKIRIAFVLDQIDYQMGGTEKQILMILDHIDQSKFDIHLCFFRYNQWISDNSDKYKIFYFDFPSFKRVKSYPSFFKFVKYLKQHQFDILVSFFTDSNKIAVPASRLAGVKKVVLSRRNFNHWVTKKEAFILKVLKPFVNSYWVNAEAIKNRIVMQENINPEKIEVIYNGFKFNDSSKINAAQLFENISQSKIVVNVANLREVKGLDVYIRAAKIVVSKFSDVHFVVVGEGDQRPVLEKLIEELGLQTQVSLVGKRTDISAILKNSDIGVLSSHSEGLSNAIIEYMASGLSVVCTNVGGAAEMVTEGENGYLVPPDNPELMGQGILKLLQDDGLRRTFGNVSRRKAFDMFQCDTMICHLSDYFQRLVSETSRTD